jgi:hypothetical protein
MEKAWDEPATPNVQEASDSPPRSANRQASSRIVNLVEEDLPSVFLPVVVIHNLKCPASALRNR